MNGLIPSSILYISLVVLGFAWLSLKKDLPIFTHVFLLLAAIFPVISLLLGNMYLNDDQHFSFTNAGPAGDWIAGSSVPFLTLATFWIAYQAYKSQREQIVIAQKDSRETRRLPIVPFLHFEIIDTTVSFLKPEVTVVHFKESSVLPRIAYEDAIALRSAGYESLYIRLTNIGLGLATQLLFEKMGECSSNVNVNSGNPGNLNSYFIQTNSSKEF